jgi:hypothetical protein
MSGRTSAGFSTALRLKLRVDMRASEVWGAATVLYVSGVALVSATLIATGEEVFFVLPFAVTLTAVYLYIVYKRYRVELVTEGDIKLFDDPDDLRILCGIYGLPRTGTPNWLRHRLAQFARANSGCTFVWVAPKALRRVASGLELTPEKEEKELPQNLHEFVVRIVSEADSSDRSRRPLVWGMKRSRSRLNSIETCPICDTEVRRGTAICGDCGADLEFYDALAESRVGRRLLAEKVGDRLRET